MGETMTKSNKMTPLSNKRVWITPVLMGMTFVSQHSAASSIEEESRVVDNRELVRQTIMTICPPQQFLGAELQARCNAAAGAGLPDNIMTQVTSEQTAAQKSVSLEMNNGQLGILSNRITAIRSGRQGGGLTISGLNFGNGIDDYRNTAAAGDDSYERLGIFVNGNIGFGDRRTTNNEAGYNLDTHGGTVGVDYRITDHFLLGTAFAYNNTTSRYFNSLGELEADNYAGAIYGSFFTDDGFFIDGIFSGSRIDYSSSRRIRYTVPTETVTTTALGDNSGHEFNVSMNTGYNFNISGLTITPHVRVDYTTNQVEALNERGGMGWALHVDEQDFDSLQTAGGVQLNYAISLPWAIIVPMARAEYIHEFKNDQRNLQAYFIQDSNQTRFNIMTDKPDRDYIVMSAGISAQFLNGISAFVNYDTVQAHSYVNNHNFSGGLRMQLSF